MKSNRQKRNEIDVRRARRRDAKEARLEPKPAPVGKIVGDYACVNVDALAPHTSWSEPDYVRRGYYLPVPFLCIDCGTHEVWTPRQQKWWYETARGGAFTTATRCRACRRRERDRRAAARKTHLEGLARKALAKAPKSS